VSDWLEIVVHTPVAAADEVAAQIADLVPAAAAGTEIRGAEVIFWVAVDDGEEVLDRTRAAARALAERGLAVDPSRVESRPAMPEAEWRDAWKRYFKVVRLTRQVVVVPSWETYQPAPDDIAIDLDPGQAFGTGAHATTRLVLRQLQALADGGTRVDRFLDVGAGSGILSIAAARMWPAATGIAVDNDPIAVDAARDNLAANRVGDRVRSTGETLDALADEQFDLVLANIQSDVLRALVGQIAPRVGGVLILSGILGEQARGVAEEYAATGLVIDTVHPDDESPDWHCAVLRRP
jgi:ribosomal protein L11 methyltransferase